MSLQTRSHRYPFNQVEVSPLFSAELELQAPDMVFQPSLGVVPQDGFLRIIDSLLEDIYKMSALVPRICHAEFTDYSVRICR